mmetsp:Transcript_11922/g.28642  ORF Transcript_11922/g.28642 Transcript_11922/m.28642 type:complete len:307 (-) Transcript_11922:2612-3532(-)
MPGKGINLLEYVPTLMAMTALVLACVFNFGCKTMMIVQNPEDATSDVIGTGLIGWSNSSFVNDTLLKIGPWAWKTNDIYKFQNTIQVFEVCRTYSIVENDWNIEVPPPDSATVAIRTFGVMATIISGFVVIYMGLAPCRSISRKRWRIYGVLLVCSSVFQGLCLMMPMSGLCTNNPLLQISNEFSSKGISDTFPNECQRAVGYRCGIVATAMFFVTGLLLLCFVKPPRKVDDENWCIYEDNSYFMSLEDADDESSQVEELRKLMTEENEQQQQQRHPESSDDNLAAAAAAPAQPTEILDRGVDKED